MANASFCAVCGEMYPPDDYYDKNSQLPPGTRVCGCVTSPLAEVMSEQVCRTCKWWGVKVAIFPGSVDFPENHVDIHRWEDEPALLPDEIHHSCCLTVSRYEKLHPTTMAYVEGYDGGYAAQGLWTKAAFSCIQWEAKE